MRRTHPRWEASMEGMPAAISGALFVMVIVTVSLAFGA
jgi:hypothetical protein